MYHIFHDDVDLTHVYKMLFCDEYIRIICGEPQENIMIVLGL